MSQLNKNFNIFKINELNKINNIMKFNLQKKDLAKMMTAKINLKKTMTIIII